MLPHLGIDNIKVSFYPVLRGVYDKFPDFFRKGTFIDSTVTGFHTYF